MNAPISPSSSSETIKTDIDVFAISCRWNRKGVVTQIGWSFFACWVFSTVKSRIPLDECFSTCCLFLPFPNWGQFCIRQKIMYLCYCRFWERNPWSFLSKAIHSIWVGCYNYIYADAESTYNMQKPRLLFLQKNAEKARDKSQLLIWPIRMWTEWLILVSPPRFSICLWAIFLYS